MNGEEAGRAEKILLHRIAMCCNVWLLPVSTTVIGEILVGTGFFSLNERFTFGRNINQLVGHSMV